MKIKQVHDLDAVTLESLFNQKIMEVHYQHNQPLPKEVEAIHIVQKVWNELLFEDEIEATIKNFELEKIKEGLRLLDMDHCIHLMEDFYINPKKEYRNQLVEYYQEKNFEDVLYEAFQQHEKIIVAFLNID